MVVFRTAAEHHPFNRFDDFYPYIHSKTEFLISMREKIKESRRKSWHLSAA